ncbi:hypothetical protein ABN028_28010 [Actinopolymorpha sp. B17G11]
MAIPPGSGGQGRTRLLRRAGRFGRLGWSAAPGGSGSRRMGYVPD